MNYPSNNPQRSVTARRKTAYGPATIAMSVVFAAVFVIELLADGQGSWRIQAQTLGVLGGNAPNLTIGMQQYWRLVTAVFMHGDMLHIAMNTYAFLILGSAIERTLGPGWMVGTTVLSGVTGNVLSAYGHASNVVAIGASGGIFGLLAMAAALTWLAPRLTGFPRSVLMQWLVFGLAIGLVAGFDNWGHFGGIAGGGICAVAAAAFKNQRERLRPVGTAFGAIATVVAVISIGMAARHVLG